MTVGALDKEENAMAATGFAYSHLFSEGLPAAGAALDRLSEVQFYRRP